MINVYLGQLETLANQRLIIQPEAAHYKTIFPNGGKQQTKEIMRDFDAEWKEQTLMGQEDNNILTMMTRAVQEREERYLMECEDQPTFELDCREVLTIGYECFDFEARVDLEIADNFVFALEELNFSNVVFML